MLIFHLKKTDLINAQYVVVCYLRSLPKWLSLLTARPSSSVINSETSSGEAQPLRCKCYAADTFLAIRSLLNLRSLQRLLRPVCLNADP